MKMRNKELVAKLGFQFQTQYEEAVVKLHFYFLKRTSNFRLSKFLLEIKWFKYLLEIKLC